MHGLPPLKIFDAREAEALNQILYTVRHDCDGRGQAASTHFPGDGAQGGAIQMVHVGVRKQNGVDRREIGNAEAGPSLTPKDDEAGGEDRIDKQ